MSWRGACRGGGVVDWTMGACGRKSVACGSLGAERAGAALCHDQVGLQRERRGASPSCACHAVSIEQSRNSSRICIIDCVNAELEADHGFQLHSCCLPCCTMPRALQWRLLWELSASGRSVLTEMPRAGAARLHAVAGDTPDAASAGTSGSGTRPASSALHPLEWDALVQRHGQLASALQVAHAWATHRTGPACAQSCMCARGCKRLPHAPPSRCSHGARRAPLRLRRAGHPPLPAARTPPPPQGGRGRAAAPAGGRPRAAPKPRRMVCAAPLGPRPGRRPRGPGRHGRGGGRGRR